MKQSARQLPGFRRLFRITPEAGRVCCEVEDDYHCMSVVLQHDQGRINNVQAAMRRAPWTTCPGAEKVLQDHFKGVELSELAMQGGKKANCTHLYDLALLAAAHSSDAASSEYALYVSDPDEQGQREAEAYYDGERLLKWRLSGMEFLQPEAFKGIHLTAMKQQILSMEPKLQEAAKLLQWASMLANGRMLSMEKQSDATRMPANCYTFQPERAIIADRVGSIKDFSQGKAEPLADYEPFQ